MELFITTQFLWWMEMPFIPKAIGFSFYLSNVTLGFDFEY